MEQNLSKFSLLLLGIKDTAIHLLGRLWHSPVLLGYLVIGTVAGFFQAGMLEVLVTAVNLIILGLFAVIIHMMTSKQPASILPIKRPKAELITGLVLFLLILGSSFMLFHLTKIPVLQASFDRFICYAYNMADVLCGYGMPLWSASYIGNAITSTAVQLIPTLIIFIAFGYGISGMGFKNNHWKLTIVLIALTILFGIPGYQYLPLYQYPFLKTLTLFLIHLFINAIPEELFFRGFLLPRCERFLKNPVNALVLTSILFGAAHIPYHIANGSGIEYALLNTISVSFPSGLLWGYLYQRTRSVTPGILFHGSYSIWGGYFLSI